MNAADGAWRKRPRSRRPHFRYVRGHNNHDNERRGAISLPAYLLRFVGGSLMLLGAVEVLTSAWLGPFYLLLGLSLFSAGWPAD